MQVCELVAARFQKQGQSNRAGFLQNVAQEVTAFLVSEGTGGNDQAALGEFWRQLLQAEKQGGTTAVHQVMRQNMGFNPVADDSANKFFSEMVQFYKNHDIFISDSDPCGANAQILSGPEGSSNTGCLEQAWYPGHFFWPILPGCQWAVGEILA